MATEIYQIDSANSLAELVVKLNEVLFEISKRLASLNIPNDDIASASTVADLVSALQSSGIGSSE